MADDYVTVATFDWPELAEEVRDRLQGEGIPARLTEFQAGGAVVGIRLEVPAEHAEDVDRLLADAGGVILPPEPEGPTWACPACGWRVSEERVTCPRCRAMRPPRTDPNPTAPRPVEPTDVTPAPEPPERAERSAPLGVKGRHKLADLDRGDFSIFETAVSFWLLICMFMLALLATAPRGPGFALPVAGLMALSLWRLRELALERSDVARRGGCLVGGLFLLHLVLLFVGLLVVSSVLNVRKLLGLS